jgi:ABC-2 type transport system ATP-binding protein
MPLMEKVLEIDKMTKRYKNNRGVNNISLDIYAGDVFGFLGPNGAGKTTVMKAIMGFIKTNEGSIKLFGQSLHDQYEQVMTKIGCMIENPQFYEHMSAYENLKMSARFYSDLGLTRVEEVLHLVGLAPFQKEKVKGYSSGMKQRLGLAAAILSKPEFVILDEPTTALDIEGIADIRKIIVDLAAEQKVTFLLSSHQVHDIEIMCNRVGIINNGKLLKVEYVHEIKTHHGISLEEYYIQQMKVERSEVPHAQL